MLLRGCEGGARVIRSVCDGVIVWGPCEAFSEWKSDWQDQRHIIHNDIRDDEAVVPFR